MLQSRRDAVKAVERGKDHDGGGFAGRELALVSLGQRAAWRHGRESGAVVVSLGQLTLVIAQHDGLGARIEYLELLERQGRVGPAREEQVIGQEPPAILHRHRHRRGRQLDVDGKVSVLVGLDGHGRRLAKGIARDRKHGQAAKDVAWAHHGLLARGSASRRSTVYGSPRKYRILTTTLATPLGRS